MANQESRLAIVIDTAQAEQNAKRLREVLKGISLDGSRTGAALGDLGGQSVAASSKVDKLNASTKELSSTLGRLKGIVAGAFAGIGIRSLLSTADTMQSLNSQVRLVTNSVEQFNAVQERLGKIANNQYAEIESLTQLYTRSQRALSQLGKTQNEVLQFTENVSMAMRVGGVSAQEQAAALLQLSQSLGSGRLAGDEFASIAEQAPILLSLVSKELGVTQGELKKLASDGKITSEVIFRALSGATEELTQQASQMPITVGQALTVLSNNYKEFVGNFINSTTGLSGIVAGAIGVIAQNFDALSTILIAGAAVWGYYALASSSFVVSTIPALVLGIQTSIMGFIAQTAAIQAAITAQGAAIASTFSLASMQGYLTATTYAMQQARITAIVTLANYKLALYEAVAATQAKIASTAGAIAVQAQYAYSVATSGNLLAIFSLAVKGAAASLVAKVSATVAAARANAIYAASMVATHGVVGATALGIRALTGAIIAKTGAMIAAVRQTSAYSLAMGGLGLAARGATGIFSTLTAAMARLGAIILAHPIMAIAATIFAVTASTRGMKAAMEDVTDAIKILGYMFADTVNLIIHGVKDAWAAVSGWFNKMTGGGTAVTNILGKVFGSWFEGTRGGFVGLIQVAARAFDSIVKVAMTAVLTLIKGFQNLGVLVRNVAAGIANGFISAFNTLKSAASSTLNWLAGKLNSVMDMWDSVTGSQSKRVRVDFDFKPTQKVGYADFVDMSWGNNAGQVAGMMDNFSVAGWVDSVIATNDAAKAMQGATDAGLDLASAYNAVGDTADKAGKKAKAAADKTKKATDKTAEAAKKLLQSFKNAEAGLRKSIFMLDPQTNFSEWFYDLSDANNELSKLSDTSKTALVGLALNKDMAGFAKEMSTRAESISREVELLNATNDLERERLKIQHELQDELKKYQSLKNAGRATEYGEIKAALEAEAASKNQLLHFQNIAAVSGEIESVINDLYKQTALLDNDSPIESLLYDLEAAGRLANATEEEMQRLAKAVDAANEAYIGLEVKKGLGDLRTELLGYGINETDSDKNDYQLADTLERLRQAHEMQLMQQDEFQNLSEIAKQRHADKMAEIDNAMYQNRAGLFASASKALLGENSRMYRMLFAIEKGYALQSAWLKSKKAVLDAYAETPGSVWNKAWAAAKAAADTGLMAAAIAAVQAPIGQAHDGIMSVPKSGTWNLEKGERVLPAHTAKAMDKKLEQSGSGEVNIIINVDAQGNSTMDAQNANQMSRQLANTIKAVVVDTLHKERRQGGILYG